VDIDERYSRQILFSGIGEEGQRRLLASRAVVVGCGALGAMHVETLARAGVGQLRLVDRDVVEMSNLHRQILFTERDAAEAMPKAVAAARRVREINSDVEVEAIVEDVGPLTVERIVRGADVVLDATDNFETRFLLNDAASKAGIPWIYGAVVGGAGVTMTIRPGRTPCLRCVFETMPPPGSAPTCDTAGVVLPAVAVVASVQSAEAIKLLAGHGESLHGGLLQLDVWESRFTRISLEGLLERGDCPVCHERRYEHLDESGQTATTLCGRGAVQIAAARGARIDLAALAERLCKAGEVKVNDYLLRFRTGDVEMTVFADARSIIKGVTDPAVARSLYSRYVGA
jgi:molybdopterin/thiamine biosynthesis adenylyltransferase